jgi:DNA-binding transcriptional MerR regulator
MPNIENQALNKLYYSIGEVAELLHVNASLLRFWEKEFNLAVSKKNKKGNRLYTVKEIEKIQRIYQFVKVEGYTLEGAKKALKSKVNHSAQVIEVNELIEENQSKQNLASISANKSNINSLELISKLEQIKNRLLVLSFENESQTEIKSSTQESQVFQEIKNDPVTTFEAPTAPKTVAPKPKAAPRPKPASNEGPTLFDF